MDAITTNITEILLSLILRTGHKDVKVMWRSDFEDVYDIMLRHQKQMETALKCTINKGCCTDNVLLEHKILHGESDIEIQIVKISKKNET